MEEGTAVMLLGTYFLMRKDGAFAVAELDGRGELKNIVSWTTLPLALLGLTELAGVRLKDVQLLARYIDMRPVFAMVRYARVPRQALFTPVMVNPMAQRLSGFRVPSHVLFIYRAGPTPPPNS